MSKGTRVYPVRLPPEQVSEILLAVARRNMHSREEEWTFSDFVRIACREKIAKMARSRGKPETLPAGPMTEWVDSDIGRLKVPEGQ